MDFESYVDALRRTGVIPVIKPVSYTHLTLPTT